MYKTLHEILSPQIPLNTTDASISSALPSCVQKYANHYCHLYQTPYYVHHKHIYSTAMCQFKYTDPTRQSLSTPFIQSQHKPLRALSSPVYTYYASCRYNHFILIPEMNVFI